MITPRTTRLVRASDLQAFREAVLSRLRAGAPLDARDRLVVIPTHAAAAHLVRTIEGGLVDATAVVLPDMATASELVPRLSERLELERPVLTNAEREVLLGLACRAAETSGAQPPFKLRPGLVAEILRFYDSLRLNQKDVDAFERLALSVLEPGAAIDRGAERLVHQTRFLVAAFRDFERRCHEIGFDHHDLRDRLISTEAVRPYRHVVVAVGDRAFDPHGLAPADWDLLSRIPALERLDVIVTDNTLAGAFHERIHRWLPGIEEERVEMSASPRSPVLQVPPKEGPAHVARDREEEVAGFARRTKTSFRQGSLRALDRAALVVRQPLPYVYIAREIMRSAGIPCQTFDTLPLAAEPYSAALDLVFSAVGSDFARGPAIALLRSPHFDFEGRRALSAKGVASLDRALAESGYLGEIDSLERLLEVWRSSERSAGRTVEAIRAAEVLVGLARELDLLRSPAPVAEHLSLLLAFLARHERLPVPDDPLRARLLRARGAILGTLEVLRDAYRRLDPSPVQFHETSALVRRWIDGQTFAPRAGDSGVHIVDAASAPFGDFDEVQLAGLVEAEWPDRPRRNIFYSTAILRDLGWTAEIDRAEGARASFVDLLSLPAQRLTVSTFMLEADALVSPSPLMDEVRAAGLEEAGNLQSSGRIFELEALGVEPVDAQWLPPSVQEWVALRAAAPPHQDVAFRGSTSPHTAPAFSVSSLERYQDCPFKFFAADVLRLDEPPEDESFLSAKARGRFIHEVFQRFFEEWHRSGRSAVTSDNVDEAREMMASVAAPLLARLPEADAALERTRLFGSAISVGLADVVLGIEVTRGHEVEERWLEHRLDGAFALGASDNPVSLRGVADRIDILQGRRLRVIDYKSGSAPNVRRAFQVPIYALCAQERLTARDGVPWAVEEAAYVALSGKRSFVPVVKPGASDATDVLGEARSRLLNVLAGIDRGEFPPKPHDEMICRWCAYPAVCRKDYVGDE